MRFALILMALGLATSAAARPAASAAVDMASGSAVRSSCTLSRVDARAGDAVALDCVIHDTRPTRLARSDAATVPMVGARTGAGLEVVTGVPRAAGLSRQDLALRAVIDTSDARARAQSDSEVVLDAEAAGSGRRMEVVAPRP